MEVEIENSFALLQILKKECPLPYFEKIEDSRNWWWPNALSFEVVVGAVLVQNTRWNQVEVALQNLRKKGILDVESFSKVSLGELENCIKNVGFFRQKAVRIQKLCQNILQDFGGYSSFCADVCREWLLEQKGIGLESCDAILNYALGREVMVADSYSQRLLSDFGYCLESYDEVQEWLRSGIVENYERVCALYGFEIPLSLVFARLHGKIVEYSKRDKNGTRKKLSEF